MGHDIREGIMSFCLQGKDLDGMRWIRQFMILLAITFLGEILRALIPLPIPAGIYGMVLLFACLCLGIVKLNQVEGAADFLIEIMPVMFIPAAVGLLNAWDVLRPVVVPVVVVTVVTTVLVMGVTGQVTQRVIRWERKRKEGKEK
mgnify:CR=1 FL=1